MNEMMTMVFVEMLVPSRNFLAEFLPANQYSLLWSHLITGHKMSLRLKNVNQPKPKSKVCRNSFLTPCTRTRATVRKTSLIWCRFSYLKLGPSSSSVLSVGLPFLFLAWAFLKFLVLVFLSFSWLSPFLLSCRRPSALLSAHPLHFYAHLQLQNGTSSTSMELRMSRGQNRSEDQTSSTSWRMRHR